MVKAMNSSRSSGLSGAAIQQSSARLNVGGQVLDMHYRVAGSGPPLFLLHPSPLSSAFMEPLMRRLAGRVTAIAPDTPGFGDSDPIAGGYSCHAADLNRQQSDPVPGNEKPRR